MSAMAASHKRRSSTFDTLTGMHRRMLSVLKRQEQSAPAQARKAAQITVESLPNELWIQIFTYLEWPGDLGTLALVSRAFYDRVLPTLYRTVVIAWAAPERMAPMLQLLGRDEQLCSCVRTLVLDDDPARYGRELQTPKEVRQCFVSDQALEQTKTKVDEKELDLVRTMLYRVLPMLSNLRDVLLCRPHPLFFSAGAWTKMQRPPERSRMSKLLGVNVNVRLWARRTSSGSSVDEEPDEVFHRSSGTDLWAVLFKRRKTGHGVRLTRLCAPLNVPRMPQQKSSVAGLTCLTLHHVRMTPDDEQSIRRWNKALRCATNLRTLCFVETQNVPHLVAGCRFAHLEDFEAVGLPVRSANRNKLLSKFIRAHAATLRVIAVQLNPIRPTSPFWTAEWLSHPEEFVNLHTLRIEAVPRTRSHGWYTHGFAFPSREEQAANASAWVQLLDFIRRCKHITDLALSGLNLHDSRSLGRHLRNHRPAMRRVMLSDELIAGFNEIVVPNGTMTIPWKKAVFRFRYALQHWIFYNVLFDGLELANSGYRPCTRRD
ncbi:hypothetical protein AURDEDRAFT_115294 [Auricularia subglabra TFB-10046 SS5]|nr:hypothetical protein AURDEDRAFT_115294 [Auricularia subglabra TFB-10046 SS5]